MNIGILYSLFQHHKEGMWIMKERNARILYTFVRQHADKIKNVLDLGTGIGASAAIIALALKEKGGEFHIDTVEQAEKCHKIAQELVPEELKAHITFHRTDPVVWQTDKVPYKHFSVFKELPDKKYDLVITDGPGPWIDSEGRLLELDNGDVLRLLIEDKINPGTFLFFDGRVKALGVLERYCTDNFFTLEALNKFCNILERKDTAVLLKDLRLEIYRPMGYFDEYAEKGTESKERLPETA